MKLDKVIAVRPNKTVYLDGDLAIKVFNNDYSKADVLNEALNQARVEETGRSKYQCVVRIYGQSLGENVYYKLRTETVETLIAPLMPEYQEDKNHEYVTYVDEEHVVQKAEEGCVVDSYCVKYVDGIAVELLEQ